MPWPSGRESGADLLFENPEPGLKIDPTKSEMLTAIAVVPKYNAMVLKVIFPKLFILVSEEIPDTNEKNTSGTMSIFKRFIKIEPPKLKIYNFINSTIESGTDWL